MFLKIVDKYMLIFWGFVVIFPENLKKLQESICRRSIIKGMLSQVGYITK